MEYFITIIGLGICAWTDIRERKIYLFVILGSIAAICAVQTYQQIFSPVVIASGICVGISFFLLYFITGGQIGAGDVLLFAMTALSMQGIQLVYCILFTFILLFGVAVFLLTVRRCKGKTQIPVAPFLLASYLFVAAGMK